MKARILTLTILALMMAVLIGCEKDSINNNLGDVTIAGTLVDVPNPCPKGEECLPGLEAALQADRVYYLRNIDIQITFGEKDGEYVEYFLVDGQQLSQSDSIRIHGTLLEYTDKHNAKYYLIHVKDYSFIGK